MGLRDLAIAALSHCPSGTSLRSVPAGQSSGRQSSGTNGTVGTRGTNGTGGTRAPVQTPIVDDFEVRVAILGRDAGLPRAWAERFTKLLVGPVPGDFSPLRWQEALDGALIFADRWACEAHGLGWHGDEVFGLHPEAPAARVDCRGLAWLLGDGSQVVSIDANGANIETPRGGRQRYRRIISTLNNQPEVA
jgi:hypothetical protein